MTYNDVCEALVGVGALQDMLENGRYDELSIVDGNDCQYFIGDVFAKHLKNALDEYIDELHIIKNNYDDISMIDGLVARLLTIKTPEASVIYEKLNSAKHEISIGKNADAKCIIDEAIRFVSNIVEKWVDKYIVESACNHALTAINKDIERNNSHSPEDDWEADQIEKILQERNMDKEIIENELISIKAFRGYTFPVSAELNNTISKYVSTRMWN